MFPTEAQEKISLQLRHAQEKNSPLMKHGRRTVPKRSTGEEQSSTEEQGNEFPTEAQEKISPQLRHAQEKNSPLMKNRRRTVPN